MQKKEDKRILYILLVVGVVATFYIIKQPTGTAIASHPVPFIQDTFENEPTLQESVRSDSEHTNENSATRLALHAAMTKEKHEPSMSATGFIFLKEISMKSRGSNANFEQNTRTFLTQIKNEGRK